MVIATCLAQAISRGQAMDCGVKVPKATWGESQACDPAKPFGRNSFLQVQFNSIEQALVGSSATGRGGGRSNNSNAVKRLGADEGVAPLGRAWDPLPASFASEGMAGAGTLITAGEAPRQYFEGGLVAASFVSDSGSFLPPPNSSTLGLRPPAAELYRLRCTEAEIEARTRECVFGLTNLAWATVATAVGLVVFLLLIPCLMEYSKHDATCASACCGSGRRRVPLRALPVSSMTSDRGS